MTNENMANFICELRKAKNLTQKQLAQQLNITDKAVSKWERGLGYPDITIIAGLAEILGVTTNELLKGSRDEAPVPKAEIIVQNTLQYAEKATMTKNKTARNIMQFIITAAFALAVLVCVICDLAVSGGLTWSLYPILSIGYAWLIIMPLFLFQKNKILMALLSVSIFTVPFLFFLEQLGRSTYWLFPLGLPITMLSLAYFWLIYFLFRKMRNQRWLASSVAIALTAPLSILINYITSKYTGGQFLKAWDAIAVGIIVFISIIFCAIGYFRNKRAE